MQILGEKHSVHNSDDDDVMMMTMMIKQRASFIELLYIPDTIIIGGSRLSHVIYTTSYGTGTIMEAQKLPKANTPSELYIG